MSCERDREAFKVEAVKQITERACPVAEVAGRLLAYRSRAFEFLT